MFHKNLNHLSGNHHHRIPLNLDPLEIQEISPPDVLSFSLVQRNGICGTPMVKAGDTIAAGQLLAALDDGHVFPSPVDGEVTAVMTAPDIRGARTGQAVLVKSARDSSSDAFPPMDPEAESVPHLIDRIKEAGLITDALRPKPLMEVIGPSSGMNVETLVILAMDREPGVSSAMQLFREKGKDALPAARLLGKIAGAKRILLAVPESMESEAKTLCGKDNFKILPVPPLYPESLESLVALRAGGGGQVRVIALECALAGLDAVRSGCVQDKKVVTVIASTGKALGNYRVPIGARIGDIFAQLGLEPGERDKVVAGGPMRGFAQYSLDGSIDAGVDALMLIPAESIIDWSDEPCVNSGACVAACPVNLQVHLIGRYAEFGLFDRTEELGIFNCIECGMCAAVCTGQRPLVQLIQLAKEELRKQKVLQALADRKAEADEAASMEEQEEKAAASSD
ncbi:MAG: 4Fe-4S dicluster domain-containing protein [Planctomycetota bacterium]